MFFRKLEFVYNTSFNFAYFMNTMFNLKRYKGYNFGREKQAKVKGVCKSNNN